MKTKLNILALLVLTSFAIIDRTAEAADSVRGSGGEMQQPIFSDFKDLKWDKILPDLGDSSPEICVLHVDPKTKATKLMIRTPKAFISANIGTAPTRRTRSSRARRRLNAMASAPS